MLRGGGGWSIFEIFSHGALFVIYEILSIYSRESQQRPLTASPPGSATGSQTFHIFQNIHNGWTKILEEEQKKARVVPLDEDSCTLCSLLANRLITRARIEVIPFFSMLSHDRGL